MKKVIIASLVSITVMMVGCSANKPDNTLQDTAKTPGISQGNQQEVPTGAAPGQVSEPMTAVQSTEKQADVSSRPVQVQFSNKPVELNTAEFKKAVFDMDKNPSQWVYNGQLPAIVDFYAVWCGPCKMAAPALAELADEYAGKVHIYKVDAEKERYLSSYFRVTGYPTFMVIPAQGQPRIFTGLPQGVRTQADIKPAFKKIIESELI